MHWLGWLILCVLLGAGVWYTVSHAIRLVRALHALVRGDGE